MSARYGIGCVAAFGLLLFGACARTDPGGSGINSPAAPASGKSEASPLAGQTTPMEEASPLVGKPAPDVDGKQLDDSPFSLREQYASNVVMLDFWATWCPPCVAELPILIKLAEEYKAKGVVLYAVNQEEDAESIREFLKENKWNLNVVLDPEGKHAQAYGINGIPQLALIGRDGVVKHLHIGYSENIEQVLRLELDSILASPAPAATSP